MFNLDIFFNLISRRKKLIGAIAFFLLGASIFFLWRWGYFSSSSILGLLKTHQISAPVLFVLAYALLVIFFIPTLPMNLGAGFLWGTWLGGLLSIVGASTGALGAFLISRYLAHDYFNHKFTGARWIKFREMVSKENWKAVAFTRINPAFPFGVTSYFFGLTTVTLKDFFYGTVFVAPGAFLFSALGGVWGMALNDQASSYLRDIFIALFSITTVIAVLYVIRKILKVKSS